MRNFLAILFAVALSAQASDIITATVVITDATSLTNGASLTHDGLSSTRIWTNSVTTPSTQIKSSTNISTAAFNLLQHLRSYPFTGVQTSATNNGVVLTGAEGAALSLTVSNSWASVSYRTNAAGSSYGVVRIPYTVETPTAQAQISDGLVDYLNQAPTNSLSASAVAMGNFLPKTMTHSALTADSAATNFVVNLTGDRYRTITATGDINFIQSTNRAAVRMAVVRIDSNGTNRAVAFNSDWTLIGTGSTNIVSAGGIAIVTVLSLGTAETDVIVKFELEGGGSIASSDIDTSAKLRTLLADESGTGALIFAGGNIGAATATTPSADDNDTSVATTAFVQGEINGDVRVYEFALSDETTPITTGTAKVTWRAPHAMTITAVRASLTAASSSGIPTVDINESGTTILSTKLTIDASEKTSTTAATPAVISDASIADDAEITFDIDVAGTDAAGLKVKIFYTK